MPAFQGSREISGNDTPTTNDDGSVITVTATATVTLTNSGWTVGESAVGFEVAGGTLTFVGAGGVTVRNTASDLATAAQYTSCVARYSATNTWTIFGTEPPQLADGSVTLAKLADVTGPTTLGRVSGTGAPEALTPAQGRAWVQVSGPIWTPEQFGAARDGTTDDSAAIQDADDEAASTGGSVEFISGTYLVDSAVAKHPGTQWSGPGGNQAATGNPGARLRAGTSGDCVTVTGPLTNRRGGIEGLRFTASATPGTAIYIDNLVGQRIDDCFVGNFDIGIHAHDSSAIYLNRDYIFGGRVGYFLDDCTDCVASDGSQFSGTDYGVDIFSGSSDVFTACRFQSSGIANLRAVDSGFLQVIGGHCDSATIAAGDGPKMGMELSNCSYSKIMGVGFYANATRHIWVRNPSGSLLSLSIIGNTFQAGAIPGIEFEATNGTVRRIVITGNTQDNFTAPLLVIPAPAAGTFQRLTVADNEAQGGVSIDAAVTNVFGEHANRMLGTTVGFFGVTPAVRAAAYSATNVTTDRAFDANATTLDELADVVGTLIADLRTYGLVQ
jgi:hypothetical protein